MFVTLEDETGATNVIVWRDLGDRQRRELLGSRLMGVYGRVEREGEVVHLIAGKLLDLTGMLGSLPTRSRDFINSIDHCACYETNIAFQINRLEYDPATCNAQIFVSHNRTAINKVLFSKPFNFHSAPLFSVSIRPRKNSIT